MWAQSPGSTLKDTPYSRNFYAWCEAVLVMAARGLTRELDKVAGDGGLWPHAPVSFLLPTSVGSVSPVHWLTQLVRPVK